SNGDGKATGAQRGDHSNAELEFLALAHCLELGSKCFVGAHRFLQSHWLFQIANEAYQTRFIGLGIRAEVEDGNLWENINGVPDRRSELKQEPRLDRVIGKHLQKLSNRACHAARVKKDGNSACFPGWNWLRPVRHRRAAASRPNISNNKGRIAGVGKGKIV